MGLSAGDHSNYVCTQFTRLTAQDAPILIVARYQTSRQRKSGCSVNGSCRKVDESLHLHSEVADS